MVLLVDIATSSQAVALSLLTYPRTWSLAGSSFRKNARAGIIRAAAFGNHGGDLGAQLRRKFAPETSYDHPTSYGGTCQRITFTTFHFEFIPRCTCKQGISFVFFQEYSMTSTYIQISHHLILGPLRWQLQFRPELSPGRTSQAIPWALAS